MTKENLNLPKTSFSMKANLPQKEPGMIEFWDKIDLYKKLREKSKGDKKSGFQPCATFSSKIYKKP